MITIKITITEQKDGVVMTQVHSHDIGTTKEVAMAAAISDGVRITSDWFIKGMGGTLTTVRNERVVKMIGGE